MSTFKATDKKKKKENDVFKATSRKTFDSAYIGKIENQANDSLNILNDYIKKRDIGGYISSKDMDIYEKAFKNYSSSMSTLNGFYKSFGMEHNEEETNNWISSLSKDITNSKTTFSKFKDEHEFNDAVKIGELNDMPSAEILPHIDTPEVKDKRNALVSRQRELEEQLRELGASGNKGVGAKKKSTLTQELNDVKKQISDLEKSKIAYTTSSGQNITWSSLYDKKKAEEDFNALYGELSASKDWKEESQYLSTNKKGTARSNALLNPSVDWDYEDINKYSPYVIGGGFSADRGYAEQTTDKEKEVFNYLYHTQGKEAAMKWHKSREDIYKNRAETKGIENAVKFAEDYPVLSDVIGVGASVISGGEFIGDFLKGDIGDTNQTAAVSSAIKGTRMDQIDWEVGEWDVFDFLYGTGTSLVESATSMAMFGSGGGIALGLSAAASGTNDALNRGMSKGQAFTSGLASGIFEGIFESWSIGAFGDLTKNLKRANFRDIAKYIGKNMWNNAKEEFLTEIANISYDYLANGDFSQYETAIRQYMNTGLSEADAKMKVAKELGVQVAEAAGSGALMGLGFGVGGSVKARHNIAQSGKAIKDAGETRNLVDLGKSLGEGTEAYEYANKITEKSKGYAIGNLLNAVKGDIPNANRVDMIKAFEERGYNTKEANLLVNKMFEQGLDSVSNIQGMRSPAQDYTDVLNDPNSTVSQRNEAYEGILRGVAENKFQRAMGKAVKNKSAIATHKASIEEKGKLPTQEENPVESKFESNIEGKDFNISNDKIIASKKLVSSENGNMAFEVTYDDGTTENVNANDISFGNEGEALVYSSVMDMNVPVGIAESLISGYKGNDSNSAAEYISGIREAFVLGKYNQEADLRSGKYAYQLTEEQRNNAFKLGGIYAKEKAIADEKAIRGETKPSDIKKQEGKMHFEGDKLSLKSVQDVSLKSLDVLSKALGKDIHIFESYVDENGKRVYKDANGNIKKAPNGFYHQADGSIWIDLNAGNRGQGTMLYTVAHELTHFIKQWSPTKFKALADFLVEQYGKEGVSVHQLVLAQQKKAKENGRTISYDVAFEEMVADSMETMLTDGKVIRELAHKDKGLFDKIKSWIDNLLRRLKKEYKNYSPESAEGQRLLEMTETFTEVQKLFTDALVDASDNFAIKGTDKAFVESYLKTQDVVYNLRAAESHQEKLAEKYTTDASIDLETLQERYAKIIGVWEKLGGELNSKFLNEWNNKVGKDRTFTIFKKQAGYKYNVELSSMCKKGVPLFEAIDTIVKKEVMNELKTKTLGKAEKEILYDILKNHNFEIPCAICYVEQARQREGGIINDFLDGKIEKNSKGKITTYKLGWNDVLNRIEKEMKKNGVDYTFRNVDKSIATDGYVPADIIMDESTQDAFYKALKKVANAEIVRWNREERKSNQKEKRQITDFKPQTIKEVFKGKLPLNLVIFRTLFNEPSSRFKISRDLLYSSVTTLNLANSHNELYSLFNSQGGVGGYKTKQAPVVYWGDILGKSWRPSTVRKEGGVRNQSNSDFQMYTLLDHAQMYIDFSAKGYYLQAYTKVLAELKLFGLSRGKINASLIPQVIEYKNADGSINWKKTMENAGLDENGNPIYDDFEGINHTEAFMLIEDAEYSKNICGICIGYSDNHIRKLLDDNRVQQIIGFHDKTDNPEKRYRGAKYAKNYNGLNEAVKVKADGTEETVHIGFNQFVSKAEKMFKYNKKTETFEGTVNHNGKEYTANDIPRLAADLYLEMCAEKDCQPAYNDFSSHKNYYKLLADFGLYDSQGNYAPHQKVQYNMPDKVPYLDKNGNKAYMSTEAYIKAELQKELTVRDSISEALADTSENGIIPQFVERVNALHTEKADTTLLSDRDSEGNELSKGQIEYFKDSKVRDENGNLLVVYHGSPKGNTTIFDKSVTSKDNDMGQGIYFSTNISDANEYRRKTNVGDMGKSYRGKMYSAYVNIVNPFVVSESEKISLTDALNLLKLCEDRMAAKDVWYELNINAKDGYVTTSQLANSNISTHMTDILAKSNKYDGIIDETVATKFGLKEGTKHIIVLDSNQIKEKTNTDPTTDPDIRYSDRVTPEEDAAYMDAYFDGDDDLMQELVEKVANRLGYKYKAYHHTENGFTVFDLSKARANMDIQGFFFSADKDAESEYGSVRYDTYLKMDNPYIVDSAEKRKAIPFDMSKENAGVIAREWLQSQGYDGVIRKAEYYGAEADEYIVFDSTQIKSAEPMTFADDEYGEGDIIPLSQRFNEENDDIRYSERDYSHDSLVSKPDMAITSVNDKVTYKPTSTIRKNIVEKAIKKASSFGKLNENGNVVIHVDDIDTDVILSKNSLAHGLDRRLEISAPVILNVGSILKNSIRINELTPKKQSAIGSYVLIGYAESTNYAYPVRMVVNQYTNEVDTIDVLYAVNTKKETVGKMPGSHNNVALPTVSNIKIADLLEFVNRHFSDVLPEDVLKHYGHTERPKGELGESALYSDRDTDSVSTRSLLANALEGAAQNDIEKNKLAQYKEKIALIEAEQKKLHELREKLFTKGIKGDERRKIQDEATRTANRINTYDRQLFNLESTTALKNVLTREKALAIKRQKQALREYKKERDAEIENLIKRNTEARKKAIESRNKTVLRHKISDVLFKLDGLLNRGNKKRNIKQGLQQTVSSALNLGRMLFNSNIENEDIIRFGISALTEKEKVVVAQYQRLLAKKDAFYMELDELQSKNMEGADFDRHDYIMLELDKINEQMRSLDKKLADVFERERARLNETEVTELVEKLAHDFAMLKESKDEYIKNSFDEYKYNRLLTLAKSLRGTTVKDMNKAQLQETYDAFKMIEHAVRTANQLFFEGQKADLMEYVENVQFEVKDNADEKKDRNAIVDKMLSVLNKFTWENLRPVDAFVRLGSKTFEKLFWNAIDGLSNAGRMVAEAGNYIEAIREKYGYSKWDLEVAPKTFITTDGKEFKPSLADMMSIYAYSFREQAIPHMTEGGFTYDTGRTYKDKTNEDGQGKNKKGQTKVHKMSDPYILSEADINKIISTLSEEQRAYVKECLPYFQVLATEGNKVSMVLHGIEIFKDKAYFPLKSSYDYLSSTAEVLNNAPTMASLQNMGMTKETTPGANNPIVLRGFDDVLSSHIEDMASYCSLALPITNLRKVFDNIGKTDEDKPTSTKALISSRFGAEAKEYFEQWIIDLNGGIKGKGASGVFDKLFSRAKGVSVAANMSVIVQQYFAITRAMEIIDPKYFGAMNKELSAKDMKEYEELCKYSGIAIIKEIGGYDVGAKGRVKDYINDRQAHKDFKYIRKKTDDVLMWGASAMDKLGWTTIWKAVKKEVVAEGGYTVGSEEFLKACAKRFNEVVTKTQVYDSVASRSGYMRSQHDAVKYATSFMSEPTVMVGRMFVRAIELVRAIEHKDKSAIKQAGSMFVRVALTTSVSQVLGKLAQSLIYGGRDDDEDEAFLEKWLSAFVENMHYDFKYLGLNNLPFARDVISIIDGWTVDRPDMTLIEDVVNAINKSVTDGCTLDEAINLVGTIGNILGIPVKNIVREFKSIGNFYDDVFVDDIKPTNLKGAIAEGFSGDDYSKVEKLFSVYESGDTQRVKDTVADWVQEKFDSYKEEEDDSNKAEKKAIQSVRASVTSKYRDEYKNAFNNKDSTEMNEIRKFLYATGLWDSLTELDKLLAKWREDASSK